MDRMLFFLGLLEVAEMGQAILPLAGEACLAWGLGRVVAPHHLGW